MFMSAVESSIVATAMPSIVADLGGFDLFSWVFAAYVLGQAVTIPIYGQLADLYGRKRVFCSGAGLFLVGSTLCGFSRSMAMLIVFRALQGTGAGAIVPVAATVVGDIYDPDDRARVQGYLNTIWGGAAVIGPVLGAFLVAQVTWAAVFWINLPVGAFSVALLAVALREPPRARRHRVDYLGSLLLVLGAGALMLALVQWTSLGGRAVAALLAAAALLLALLYIHERRTQEPMLPLDLWRNRVVAASGIGALSIGAVMIGVTAFVPTYVQGAMGRSPLLAGFALCAMSIGWGVSGAGAGWLMARTSYRMAAAAGGSALMAGSLVLIALNPERGPLWAAAGSMLIGLGMGFSHTTFLVAAQSSVAMDRRGAATSVTMFMRMFGQSLGAAIYGGVINSGVGSVLGGGRLIDRLMDPSQRHTLAPAEIARLTAIIADALHQVYLLVGVTALIALLLAFRMPAGRSPSRAES